MKNEDTKEIEFEEILRSVRMYDLDPDLWEEEKGDNDNERK